MGFEEHTRLTIASFFNESHYMFVYWIIGAFFDDLETLTLAVGIVRSFESVGSCLSFGIGAAKVDPMVNLIVAFVMFAITVPSTTFAVLLVPERPEETKLVDGSSEQSSIRDSKVVSKDLVREGLDDSGLSRA